MDWSLLQPNAKRQYLRDVRAYKKSWYYYTAMVIDVILRFNWIFYIIYTHDLQHSSVASFLVAFSEVTRRGMWTLFRVENEHCANVIRFKASRDVPLPYPLAADHATLFAAPHSEHSSPEPAGMPTTSSPSLHRNRSATSAAEAGETPGMGENTLRRRLTRVFAEAHTQDFEKKRKPGAGDSQNPANQKARGVTEEDDEVKNSSDDDDDDDDIEDEADIMSADDLVHREGQLKQNDSG
jgi:hypothetical protein